MLGYKTRAAFKVVLLLHLMSTHSEANAAESAYLYFKDTGEHFQSWQENAKAAGVRVLPSRLSRPCLTAPAHCLTWNVHTTSSTPLSYITKVNSAISIWNSATSSTQIQHSFGASIVSNAAPFSADLRTPNPGIELEHFLISFNPPAQMNFTTSEIMKVMYFAAADLTANVGNIKWAGIFFNPSMRVETDYDLVTALLHGMGRAMGVSQSGLAASVMFPMLSAEFSKTQLHRDEIDYLGSLYGTSTYKANLSKISGKVTNGRVPGPVEGAHLMLLPSDKVNEFSRTLNRALFVSSAFSRNSGTFEFNVMQGTYVLLLEARERMLVTSDRFDNWIQNFGDTFDFETEFYDGKTRESNQEPILAFSPRSILYAATLGATTGQTVTGIELITNVAEEAGVTLIAAGGANHETLSKYTANSNKEKAFSAEEAEEETGGGGGCALSFDSQNPGLFTFILLLIAFALCLRLREK